MAESFDVEEVPELTLLPPGSVFGNYVVHECIGQGAMGRVHRAVHALLEKPVALKIMDSSLLGSAEARQRFLREGQAAASIKHPNVVDITDVGFVDGAPYLVMELLLGEDLSTRLERDGWLGEREATSLVIPIIAALATAHDAGVVHRDLKPSNIFLAQAPDGEVMPKVLDFGISKLSRALASKNFGETPFNRLMGSPLYLPPEALKGSGGMTDKSDQYALGVVFYECLTGRPPFSGDSLLSLMNAISASNFQRPRELRPDLSPELEQAVLRAMHPDPARRFVHVRDFGRALLEVSSPRTRLLWSRTFGADSSEPSQFPPRVPVTPPPVSSPPRSTSVRPRGPTWLLLLLVAALCAMASAWWLGARPSTHEGAPAAPVSRLPLEQHDSAVQPLPTLPTTTVPRAIQSSDAAPPSAPALTPLTGAATVRTSGQAMSDREPLHAGEPVLDASSRRTRLAPTTAAPRDAARGHAWVSREPGEIGMKLPAERDDLSPRSIRGAGAPRAAPSVAMPLTSANESPILD